MTFWLFGERVLNQSSILILQDEHTLNDNKIEENALKIDSYLPLFPRLGFSLLRKIYERNF